MQRANKSDLHVHSTFSDGRNTPEEIVKHAIANGYDKIAIIDHIRRTSDWLDSFAIEIERLKRVFQERIILYSGIEAKVINLHGDIDANLDFFPKVDLVLGAFHRIPKGEDEYLNEFEISVNRDKALELWFTSFLKLLENRHVNTIAHPTAILKRNNISVPYYMKNIIARKAAECGKILEVNSKYQVPDDEFINILRLNNVNMSFGSDSHSIEEMV